MNILASAGNAVNISDALSTLSDVFSSAIGLITANPIMLIFFASGLLGVGFGLVRRARNAAGGSK